MTEDLKKRLFDNSKDTFGYVNGIRIVNIEEGYCQAEFVMTEAVKNVWGTPHGGILFTLSDIAAGAASITVRGKQVVTVSANIQYVSSSLENEKVVAVAKVSHYGKTMSFCNVELKDEKGTLLATVQTVMKFLRWDY